MTFKMSTVMGAVEIDGEEYMPYADHLDLLRRFQAASREINQLAKQLQKSEALEAVAKLQDAAVAQLYCDRWPFAAAESATQNIKDEYAAMSKAAGIIANQILQSAPLYAKDALEQIEKQKIEEGITKGLELAVQKILSLPPQNTTINSALELLYNELNMRDRD